MSGCFVLKAMEDKNIDVSLPFFGGGGTEKQCKIRGKCWSPASSNNVLKFHLIKGHKNKRSCQNVFSEN